MSQSCHPILRDVEIGGFLAHTHRSTFTAYLQRAGFCNEFNGKQWQSWIGIYSECVLHLPGLAKMTKQIFDTDGQRLRCFSQPS